LLDGGKPEGGRLRGLVLAAWKCLRAHASERAHARKRGGGCRWISLDLETAEGHYQVVLPDRMTAEKVYEARWAAALIEGAFDRLRAELESAGKGRQFEVLQEFLVGEQESSYTQAADALGLPLGTLKTTIHRLRGRYRALLREEVARTVANPDDVDEELRQLRSVLRA